MYLVSFIFWKNWDHKLLSRFTDLYHRIKVHTLEVQNQHQLKFISSFQLILSLICWSFCDDFTRFFHLLIIQDIFAQFWFEDERSFLNFIFFLFGHSDINSVEILSLHFNYTVILMNFSPVYCQLQHKPQNQL